MMRAATLILVAFASVDLPAAPSTLPAPAPAVVVRGGRVGWARLITSSEHWQRHAQADPTLSEFIRSQTSLNMDPQWFSANPSSVEGLCAYPLIFTNNLADVRDARQRRNLAEYLRRGGFLLIDSCINSSVTSDPDRFLSQHTTIMRELFPGARVQQLPATHAVYRQYFSMRETPPHSYMSQIYDRKWARHGLYGVFNGERMVALISLSGLQCGWDKFGPPGHAEECMKMLVNIYVHVMTR